MKIAARVMVALLAVAATLSVGYVVFEKTITGQFAYAATTPLAIGAAQPEFTMKDSMGKEHQLADYKGKIVVLNFSSPNCPFSKGADPSINALAEKYHEAAFLGVDSNQSVSDEDLNKHIAAAKVPYPILKDPDNVYADALGARVTPELFIFNKDGKLAYHGAPDNRTSPEGDASEHYADDALKALTSGGTVETAEVPAWGCGIKRAKKS